MISQEINCKNKTTSLFLSSLWTCPIITIFYILFAISILVFFYQLIYIISTIYNNTFQVHIQYEFNMNIIICTNIMNSIGSELMMSFFFAKHNLNIDFIISIQVTMNCSTTNLKFTLIVSINISLLLCTMQSWVSTMCTWLRFNLMYNS